MLTMPLRAVANPYAYVVGAYGVNTCLIQFGYLTSNQAVELLLDAASSEGITGYQVKNILTSSSFDADAISVIEMLGGCEQIASEFRPRLRRSKRFMADDAKLSPDIYYGPNAAEEFSRFNDMNP